MSDPLATYLQDHLAGSHFALELLDSLHDQYEHEELGKFAFSLSIEIKKDQDLLIQVIENVGEKRSAVSEAAGWISEKISQLKLRRTDANKELGTFESLETLVVGIQGKMALWRALGQIRGVDVRVPALDFESLTVRAQSQFERADQERLKLIQETFGPRVGKE
jgi:hypothetical protein